MKDLGYKIRKVRELRDLKREYMAECLDITPEWYRKIETGEYEPKISQIEKICEVLKVSILDLLSFKEGQIFNNYNQNGDFIANQHIAGEQIKDLYERLIQANDAEIAVLKSKM